MTHCHCSTATFYLTSRTQAICSLARAYLDTRSQTDVSFKSAQGYVGEECLNIRPHTHARAKLKVLCRSHYLLLLGLLKKLLEEYIGRKCSFHSCFECLSVRRDSANVPLMI